MALTFSHSTGYHGVAAFGNQKILCTGGSISVNQDPIASSGVWGSSAKSAAQIAYAYNYLRVEGSANYELTTGLFPYLKYFAITHKTNGGYVTLLPDGTNGFQGKGWCNQLSFECSEGAALTGSLGFMCDAGADDGGIKTGEAKDTFYSGEELAGATLIPYYCSSAYIGAYNAGATGGVSDVEIISWNCSCNTDMQLLKLCKGETEVPVGADYIVCGENSCDGSITVFQLQGEFAPEGYHRAKTAVFSFYEPSEDDYTGDVSFSNKRSIRIPKVLYTSGSTSMTTGSSYIQADFNFTGYGDGTENGVFQMSNTNSGTQYDDNGLNPGDGSAITPTRGSDSDSNAAD